MNDTTVLASAAQKATRALKKSDIELMAEDWLEELHRYKACGTPTAAQDVAVSICKLACEALPDQNMQYDLEGFVVMVEVLKEMEGLVSSTNLIELGTLIMMKRPYCPCNALCNKPVEANDSTQTVIELFGLLSKHAIEGFDSPNCVNVAHLLRQVLAQNAQTMTVEQMRPFLERSPTMTWECQGSVSHLGVYQGAALAFFENQHELSTKAFYVVPNQAWIALLNNSFPEGTEGCTPDDVLMGATSAERFDQLAGKILEIAKAGIKVEMRLSDVVLIAQILERMTHIANEEAGTQRGQRYATAVVSLIDIVIPRYEKLKTRHCI